MSVIDSTREPMSVMDCTEQRVTCHWYDAQVPNTSYSTPRMRKTSAEAELTRRRTGRQGGDWCKEWLDADGRCNDADHTCTHRWFKIVSRCETLALCGRALGERVSGLGLEGVRLVEDNE